ncbi:MAG: 6-pyruvoyl tetrahydropterin synthase [Nitrospirae bacterium]|nr:MAG: 6-pyruvoyl tetrahydropterin synthase [Nitrospirota bacterium]
MAKATLTKRIEFSASHRYHNPAWDAERNRQVFGACNYEHGHGHNYLLEVTLKGEVDAVTGMILNLYDLKQILTEFLEEFDHKHLNLDTPYFRDRIPTTENFALVLWERLASRPETRHLDRLRLYESEVLFAEVTDPSSCSGSSAPSSSNLHVTIGRRYSLADGIIAGSRQHAGWPFTLEVLIHGPIDTATGQIVNLTHLDQAVQRQLGHIASEDQYPRSVLFPLQDVELLRTMWTALSTPFPGLSQLSLHDLQGTILSYHGDR